MLVPVPKRAINACSFLFLAERGGRDAWPGKPNHFAFRSCEGHYECDTFVMRALRTRRRQPARSFAAMPPCRGWATRRAERAAEYPPGPQTVQELFEWPVHVRKSIMCHDRSADENHQMTCGLCANLSAQLVFTSDYIAAWTVPEKLLNTGCSISSA